MEKTLTNSKSLNFKKSNFTDAVASLKVIFFKTGNVNLALRIETVYKVLNQAPVYGSGNNKVGIAHIGDREVTVVDLDEQLFNPNINNQASNKHYLVIAQNSKGELYGIPVAEVPVLREIPLSSIRVLPESYRHADILGLASHVAVIPDVEPPVTVFMLDVEQMLSFLS